MKPSFSKRAVAVATYGIALSLLVGCSWSIGGGGKHTCPSAGVSAPTRGQELIDLKRALDAGVITDGEYQAQKDRILGR